MLTFHSAGAGAGAGAHRALRAAGTGAARTRGAGRRRHSPRVAGISTRYSPETGKVVRAAQP